MLTVLFFLFNYYLFCQTEKTTVSLTINSAQSGILTIYWRSRSQEGYTEKNSVSVNIEPRTHRYTLKVPSPVEFTSLRIDPLNKPGRMVIESLVFSHPFYFPEKLDFPSFMQKDQEISDLSNVSFTPETGLSFESTGKDPWFVVHPKIPLNFTILILWMIASQVVALIFYLLLNQRVIKGGTNNGILWLEDSGDFGTDFLPLITSLHEGLTGLTLIKATETVSVRCYCFSFSNIHSKDFHRFINEMRRVYPHIHIRIQFNRSGEV
ncbi:MAG: hypothetical protein Q8R88_08650 [Desulfoprunum sp.]|nr:hypothetical protein [Desulfoprunum sp.]